jgi:hypothetical protein
MVVNKLGLDRGIWVTDAWPGWVVPLLSTVLLLLVNAKPSNGVPGAPNTIPSGAVPAGNCTNGEGTRLPLRSIRITWSILLADTSRKLPSQDQAKPSAPLLLGNVANTLEPPVG